MTTDKTLQKADAVLEILLKADENDSFAQVLREIINRWRDLE